MRIIFFKGFVRLFLFHFLKKNLCLHQHYIMLDYLLNLCFWFLKVWDRALNIVKFGPSKYPISPTCLSLKNQRFVLLLVSMEMLQLELNCFWLWQNFSA